MPITKQAAEEYEPKQPEKPRKLLESKAAQYF